jgi:anaerobic selenocysteine-containing dehydrogenase
VKCRRGACLCGLQVSDRIKPGVVSNQHGAWFEPENTPAGRIDVHGNANTIAIDVITSKIARGNVSSTGNVEVSLWKDEVPPVRIFNQPRRVNAVK